MKKGFALIVILIVAYSGFVFYKNDLSYEKSVDELTQKTILLKSDLYTWYKKTNRMVSPMPFFSFPIVDFLAVFLGILGVAWFLIRFLAQESK